MLCQQRGRNEDVLVAAISADDTIDSYSLENTHQLEVSWGRYYRPKEQDSSPYTRLESIMLQNLPIMLFDISPIFCLLCLFLCFLDMHYAFILCVFSLCREVLHMIEYCKWKSVTSTANSNSLKLGCAPDLVDILEQVVWGHIYRPSKAIDILLSVK